jgi:HD-GYP domain-containing protein (c-di-GMP phosphodiesterase class II)
VPSDILTKPGKLDLNEFNLVKKHSNTAYKVLKNLKFPWPVSLMIYQHHERLNGSGYPEGITGDGISVGARVVSVADVVEAMTSHRPYRPALGIDSALQEITQNSDILYDSETVNACLRLFNGKKFQFTV